METNPVHILEVNAQSLGERGCRVDITITPPVPPDKFSSVKSRVSQLVQRDIGKQASTRFPNGKKFTTIHIENAHTGCADDENADHDRSLETEATAIVALALAGVKLRVQNF